jgi:4-amino-4-deoxy-L-arabinose transferase-like glycosyltransferase
MLREKLKPFFTDSDYIAAFFVSFVLVFIKKWEVGGHIDSIWYQAIAKNVFQSGNYFHFGINPYFFDQYYDHFPLTYWVLATTFKVFGVSDFTASLYPMLCSFIGYLALFKTGERLVNKRFGVICLLTWALCFAGTKLSGSVRMDVPLTCYFTLCLYFFMRGLDKPKSYYGVSVAFALGVFTKGPIIFGFGLGLVLWTLAARQFSYLREKHFWGAFGLLLLLLAIPFWPALYFDGKNYYTFYYIHKSSYLQPESSSKEYFFYFWRIAGENPLTTVTFLLSMPSLWLENQWFKSAARKKIQLCWWICWSIIVPLSLFQVKFFYYMTPFYPFFAVIAAMAPYRWLSGVGESFSVWLRRIAVAAIMLFVAFPLKTSGKRPKTQINMVNILKFDKDIATKKVYFLGDYDDDMQLFQTFKFYGNISVRPLRPDQLNSVDLNDSYLLVHWDRMPVQLADHKYERADCLFTNEYFCILTNRQNLQYQLPDKLLPHEIY